jgi:enoyl-CoA hydratase/carnithine racemase
VATSYEEIVYDVDGPVATITINRPTTLNALTDLTQAEIRHALAASEKNAEVIGTVLTGAGRGFCSGVDMILPPTPEIPTMTPTTSRPPPISSVCESR